MLGTWFPSDKFRRKKVINAVDIYKNLEVNFVFVKMVVLLNYLLGIVR